MDFDAVRTTLALATSATLVLAAAGTPLAWWLARSRSRLRPFVETVVALPLVLPPTVLGYYLLVGLAPDGPLGRLVLAAGGPRLPFTFGGLLVGSVLFNLPFFVRPASAAFAGVDRRLFEAAECLGASPPRVFFRIGLPLARRGLLAGAVLAFAHATGEFGVVLMLGGNIPGATRTLSVALYDDVQALEYGRAGTTAFVLLVASFVLLALVQRLERNEAR
jgi:molybdate transport system permease protein